MTHNGSQHGFSLIEALTATAILSGVVVAALTFYSFHSDSYARGQSAAATRQNARVATESMARELRMAGFDTSGVRGTLSSPTALQVADAARVSFIADVTDDGVLDRVTYQAVGGSVRRTLASWDGSAFSGATTGDLADGIASLEFRYYDRNDTQIAAPVAPGDLPQVIRVRITLVTSETTMGEQESFPLVTDVRIRNDT